MEQVTIDDALLDELERLAAAVITEKARDDRAQEYSHRDKLTWHAYWIWLACAGNEIVGDYFEQLDPPTIQALVAELRELRTWKQSAIDHAGRKDNLMRPVLELYCRIGEDVYLDGFPRMVAELERLRGLR